MELVVMALSGFGSGSRHRMSVKCRHLGAETGVLATNKEAGGDGRIRTADRGFADPRLRPLGYVASVEGDGAEGGI